MDPCFIHCHIFMQKLLFDALEQLLICQHCFLSTVSKRNTRFEHSFLIDKCSCKMVNTLPSDIFSSSAISRNFNLQSTKMSLGVFCCFPGQLPNLDDPSVQYHLFKASIPSLEQSLNNTYQAIALPE